MASHSEIQHTYMNIICLMTSNKTCLKTSSITQFDQNDKPYNIYQLLKNSTLSLMTKLYIFFRH